MLIALSFPAVCTSLPSLLQLACQKPFAGPCIEYKLSLLELLVFQTDTVLPWLDRRMPELVGWNCTTSTPFWPCDENPDTESRDKDVSDASTVSGSCATEIRPSSLPTARRRSLSEVSKSEMAFPEHDQVGAF